mmetsp:Transcript_119862/g.339242  ORF Transcript_119862/g.339242 Transcript_119862/m.339242 type:complete len:205 (+) Transcript_119862:306-920(+)
MLGKERPCLRLHERRFKSGSKTLEPSRCTKSRAHKLAPRHRMLLSGRHRHRRLSNFWGAFASARKPQWWRRPKWCRRWNHHFMGGGALRVLEAPSSPVHFLFFFGDTHRVRELKSLDGGIHVALALATRAPVLAARFATRWGGSGGCDPICGASGCKSSSCEESAAPKSVKAGALVEAMPLCSGRARFRPAAETTGTGTEHPIC